MNQVIEKKGYVHSIETFGTVDGPGIRFVVFLQGCLLRCQYCHNPDTWKLKRNATLRTADEILVEYEEYKPFLKDGGITITGGEPLLQFDFVLELFTKAKAQGIHTCIDTSGFPFRYNDATTVEKFEQLMQVTDLILLDIKHINDEEHLKLTGVSNDRPLQFALWLSAINKPVWIRHVVIPGSTLNDKYLYQLGLFLGRLKNIERIEILPYHLMGVNKWAAIGKEYPLEGVPATTKEEGHRAQQIVLKGIQKQHEILKNQP